MASSIQARTYKPHQKLPLTGFATFILPYGLVIKECAFFERDGRDGSRYQGNPIRRGTGRQRMPRSSTSKLPALELASRSKR
jgi:hypothetical protein